MSDDERNLTGNPISTKCNFKIVKIRQISEKWTIGTAAIERRCPKKKVFGRNYRRGAKVKKVKLMKKEGRKRQFFNAWVKERSK